MKTLLLGLTGAAALAISASAVAATPGWGVGAMVGWDKYTNTGSSGTTIKTKSDSGLAYGLNGSYNFSNYWGLGFGFTKYSDLTWKTSGSNTTVETMKYWSLDLMAMGYLPVGDDFDLVGGLGMAYVKEKYSGGQSSTNHFYRPKLLVGATWAFDQNWGLELSYSRIFGKGDIKTAGTDDNGSKYLPDLNVLGLGVNYNF